MESESTVEARDCWSVCGVFVSLQDKLEREEQVAKVNALKLQNQWRVIMRKSQSSEPARDW